MNFTMEQYQESAQALRARLGGFVPKVAMVLGSGLGYLGDEVEDPIAVDYRDIPGPQGTPGVRPAGGPAGGCDAGPDAPL